jgi:gliding motility-associated-like protein
MTSKLPRNISRLILTLLIISGSGSGSLLYSQQHISGTINTYLNVTGGAAFGTDLVSFTDTVNFYKYNPGDTVLLIQMKGVESVVPESPSYGQPVQLVGSPGKYEFLIILSKNNVAKTIRFKNNLINDYKPSGDVQLIHVKSYYKAIVDAAGLTCAAWDSTKKTGGVLAIIVGKTLTLNGDISVTGLGFKGAAAVNGIGTCTDVSSNNYSYDLSYNNSGLKGEGIMSFGGDDMITYLPVYPYYAKGRGANMTAGGGGNGMYSGGGGGANIGGGGKGGLETCSPTSGGVGGRGTSLTALDDGKRLFLGGGGGGSTFKAGGTATAGGNGGGIIIIICNELDGNGHSIKADGLIPTGTAAGTGGAGGGGAGGSVAIYLEGFTSAAITLSAKGGQGGSSSNNSAGDGGGGGGGLIWTNLTTLPGNVTKTVAAGLKGACPGTAYSIGGVAGTVLTGFIPALNGFLFNTINSSFTGDLTDSICSNNVPYPILGTVPVGGSGFYTYLWQKKNSGIISWAGSDISSSNVQNYTFPGVEADTFYIRRVITDDVTALTDTSKPARIVVQPKILNNDIRIISNVVSLTDTICFNGDPRLIDQAPLPNPDIFVPTTKNLFYSWQSRTSAATWGITILGTGKSYDPPAALQDTTWYRRKVVSGRCADSTAIVKFTVLPLIGNNNISADQEICHGMTFADLSQKSGFVLAGGDNTYRYKWQISSTGSAGPWINATGTINTSGYNPPESATDAEVKSYYRRMVFSGNHDACKDSSSALLLTEWKKISSNLITSADQTICSGSTPLIINAAVPLDGDHVTYNKTWLQSKNAGTTWNPAALPDPGNQVNYQPPALTDTTWYRRYVTSGAGNVCKDSGNIVVVNVHKPITNNKIALPSGPKDTTICLNQLIPLIKGADPSGGTNNPVNDIYLWQVSSPGNNTWNTASGTVNGMSYQTGTLANASANPLFYYYRRSFTSGMCSTFSDTVSVKVLPKITNNTISADQAVCYNRAPAALTGPALSGGDASVLTWKWQQSIDAGTSWNTALNTSNTQNYTPPSLTVPTGYRRVIFSGLSDCCKDTSNVVNITINPLPVSTITPATDTICEGVTKPFTLAITGSISSPWNVTYKETYLKNNTIISTTIPSVSTATSTIQVTPSISGATTDSASFSYAISKVTDSKGCDAVLMTGSRKLVVYKMPLANAGADDDVCGPEYTLIGTKNVGSGRWFYPGIPVVDSVISGDNFTVTVDSTVAGLNWPYTFLWKVMNWTCQSTDQATIAFYKRASLAVTGPDKPSFITSTFIDTLHAISPVIGTGVWEMVSGGSPIENDSIAMKLQVGENVFKWTVTNGVCITSDLLSINTLDIQPPEGFSPNGDGFNDEFEIMGLDTDPSMSEVTLIILNSSGSQVYHTDNLNGNVYKQWNGENEKGPLPDGTYYYLLTVKPVIGAGSGTKSGVIVLKRDI